ncbi:hypothetical protein RKD32_006817 [Streptomyces sp. SAI-195]
MRWGDFVRGKRAPLAVAAGSLGVALVGGCSLVGEISDARRIDASPLRLQGVVDRVVQVKGGARVRVSYQVGGQRFGTEDLPVGQRAGSTEPTVGTAVCLEASTEHPGTVRLCGQRYPGGDNMIPTEGLVVLAGAAGALMAAGWTVTVTRQETRERERSESANRATS